MSGSWERIDQFIREVTARATDHVVMSQDLLNCEPQGKLSLYPYPPGPAVGGRCHHFGLKRQGTAVQRASDRHYWSNRRWPCVDSDVTATLSSSSSTSASAPSGRARK